MQTKCCQMNHLYISGFESDVLIVKTTEDSHTHSLKVCAMNVKTEFSQLNLSYCPAAKCRGSRSPPSLLFFLSLFFPLPFRLCHLLHLLLSISPALHHCFFFEILLSDCCISSLSLIKTVPRSFPWREGEYKNSSSSGSSRWFPLQLVFHTLSSYVSP